MIRANTLRAVAAALTLAALTAPAGIGSALAATPSVTEATSEVSLEVNEGQLVRLEAASTRVFIANPDVADVSIKSQRLVSVDRNDRMIASIRIQVNHNLSRLNQSLDALVTDGDVNAISIDGGIVLTGNVVNPTDAENARRLAVRFIDEKKEEIINQIRVTAPNQVNLRVRIAEVQRNIIKQFGINWENAFKSNDFTLGLATGENPVVVPSLENDFVDISPGDTLSPPIPIDPLNPSIEFFEKTFITRQGGVNSIFGETSFGALDLNMLIDALATDGLVTILAEPNLTALSGETASFLAGGEFPIPLVEDDGVTVEFKEFGVSLAFTPTVMTQNRISMRVRPEVSQLSTAGQVELSNFVIPGLTTRRAETTVELASGQSFAIAGLFLDSTLQDLRQVPGLSHIPILGQLFDSDRFERRETELVIIVTPYLVRPVKGPLPLPTDPYFKRPEVAVRSGNMAQSPYAPQAIPLNDGSPLAQNSAGRAGFIVE
jgi:pilus assembly protein CpaC